MSATGSLIYMPPELLKEHKGGRHTDWWAVGVLSYELMTGRTPWSSLSDKKLIKKEIQTMSVLPPRNVSRPAGQFICALLRQNHSVRLGSRADKDVKAAAFFDTINWDETSNQTAAAALAPGAKGCSATDRESSLKAYTTMTLTNVTAESQWTMGLDNVEYCPDDNEHPFF